MHNLIIIKQEDLYIWLIIIALTCLVIYSLGMEAGRRKEQKRNRPTENHI